MANKNVQASTHRCDKTNSILHRFGFKIIDQDKSSIGNSTYKLVKNRNHSCMSGQVMLITVVMISGAVLASTSLAGLLILYQLRQATDAAASMKAIFAADAGLERAFYNESKLGGAETYPISGTLDNGAKYTATKDVVNPLLIKSIGQYGKVARAFQGGLPPPITP